MMKTQQAKQRGQSSVEFALLIAAVIGAGIVMSKYITRAASARTHDVYASQIDGGGLVNFTTLQYEPYYNRGNVVTTQDGTVTDGYDKGATDRDGNRHALETGTRNVDGADQMGSDDQWLQ